MGKRRWGGACSKGTCAWLAHNYEHIISVENLLAAWREFVKGKRKKRDVQEFQHWLMDNVLALHRELAAGTYQHGGYAHFKIGDPKPRDIHKASVRDRLVHHALHRTLYPFFDRKFVADSYSCRKRKGTHRAMERFHQFAYKVSRNHTRTCWVLKCDVRKFFASIDQGVLFGIVRKHIADERTKLLLAEVVCSFCSCCSRHYRTHQDCATAQNKCMRKGFPLGNLTSQLLVNVYMNAFDQFVKHKLKAKYYVRYADDFVILSHEKMWLESMIPKIAAFLDSRLKLQLHTDKVSIRTLASGVDFLGWVHFSDHRVLRTSTKRRMMKRTRGSDNKASLRSYIGLLSHGNAHVLSAPLKATLKQLEEGGV